MQKGNYDFNDFLVQAQSVKSMGNMGSMLKMIPGMANKINDDMLFEAEKRMKRSESIIKAMTAEERSNPDLLARQGGSQLLLKESNERIKQLAIRSGFDLKDVQSVIYEFNTMKKMMTQQLKVNSIFMSLPH